MLPFIIHIVVAIILAMGTPALFICYKLDERFDRLEDILEKNCKLEQEIEKGCK